MAVEQTTGASTGVIKSICTYVRNRAGAYNPFAKEKVKSTDVYVRHVKELENKIPSWLLSSLGIIPSTEVSKLQEQVTKQYCKEMGVEKKDLNDKQKEKIEKDVHGTREAMTARSRMSLIQSLMITLPQIFGAFTQVGIGTGITTTISTVATSLAFDKGLKVLADFLPQKGGLPVVLLTLLQGFGFAPVQGIVNSIVEALFGWLKCLDWNHGQQPMQNSPRSGASLNYSQGLTDQMSMYSV